MRQLKTIMLVVMCLALCACSITHCIPTGAEERVRRSWGEPRHERLRGLDGVKLFVWQSPFEERPTRLQTYVKWRLRKAGIRMLSWKEWQEGPGHPNLYLHVNAVEGDVPYTYACSVFLRLGESVRLARDNDIIVMAGTWYSDSVFMATEKSGYPPVYPHAAVRNAAADLLDEFIKDYFAANPIDRSTIEQKKENE